MKRDLKGFKGAEGKRCKEKQKPRALPAWVQGEETGGDWKKSPAWRTGEVGAREALEEPALAQPPP